MKTLPGSPFEVVEAKFLFHLLMRLLANPPCLDGNGQSAQIGRGRQVGEVILLLSRGPVFADEPSLVPRQMLLTLVPDPLRRSVGDPHADGGKADLGLTFAGRQLTEGHSDRRACLRPVSIDIRDMPLSRATPLGNGPYHLHAEGVDFEMPRDADSPYQLAGRKLLAEHRAQSISRICHDTAEAQTGCDQRSISASEISGLVRAVRYSSGTPARFNRAGSSSNSQKEKE